MASGLCQASVHEQRPERFSIGVGHVTPNSAREFFNSLLRNSMGHPDQPDRKLRCREKAVLERAFDWFEDTGSWIPDQLPTCGDTEKCAVQFKFTAFDPAFHPRECHQVPQAQLDGSIFEIAQIFTAALLILYP